MCMKNSLMEPPWPGNNRNRETTTKGGRRWKREGERKEREKRKEGGKRKKGGGEGRGKGRKSLVFQKVTLARRRRRQRFWRPKSGVFERSSQSSFQRGVERLLKLPIEKVAKTFWHGNFNIFRKFSTFYNFSAIFRATAVCVDCIARGLELLIL